MVPWTPLVRPLTPRLSNRSDPAHSPWYGFVESASHQIQNPLGVDVPPNVPNVTPLKTTCSEFLGCAPTIGASHRKTTAATRSKQTAAPMRNIQPPSLSG